MRDFSDYEKRIIRRILEVFSIPGSLSVLGNILEYELNSNLYIEIQSETNCPVQIKKSYIEEITRKFSTIGLSELIKNIESSLLLALILIAYLEKEHLILLSGDLDLNQLGEKESTTEYIEYSLKDDKLKNLLFRYSRKKITPTEGLKKLVNNNFKSDEELRIENKLTLNRKSLNWTSASVMIAGIALIVSIIIPFNQNQTLIMDKEFIRIYDSLNKRIDTIYIINQSDSKFEKIDSLNND